MHSLFFTIYIGVTRSHVFLEFFFFLISGKVLFILDIKGTSRRPNSRNKKET